MRIPACLLVSLLLLWPAFSLAQATPQQPSAQQAEPSPRVESHDIPEDDEDEDETPWTLYGVSAGFVLFAAIVFLVISRGDRSGRG